jgi:hypothetical protein
VDTAEGLQQFLGRLNQLKPGSPKVFIYCRGKHKTLSVLQIFIAPANHTWIWNVTTLGGRVVFDTKSSHNHSIRGLLESVNVDCFFWDIRMAAHVLFWPYKIRLAGYTDLQFMELAARRYPQRREFLRSLAVSVTNDSREDGEVSPGDAIASKLLKGDINAWLKANSARYDLFEKRPWPKVIGDLSSRDAKYMGFYSNLSRTSFLEMGTA